MTFLSKTRKYGWTKTGLYSCLEVGRGRISWKCCFRSSTSSLGETSLGIEKWKNFPGRRRVVLYSSSDIIAWIFSCRIPSRMVNIISDQCGVIDFNCGLWKMLEFSTNLFACGWYGEERILLIFKRAERDRNRETSNWRPWFLIILTLKQLIQPS